MAYTDNKAPGRKNQTDTTAFKGVGGAASNQARMGGTGARKVSPSAGTDSPTFKGAQRLLSNQVKLSANPFGTDTLKQPLNSYRKRVYPAVSNPDPVDRSGNRKAPGRTSGGGPSNI